MVTSMVFLLPSCLPLLTPSVLLISRVTLQPLPSPSLLLLVLLLTPFFPLKSSLTVVLLLKLLGKSRLLPTLFWVAVLPPLLGLLRLSLTVLWLVPTLSPSVILPMMVGILVTTTLRIVWVRPWLVVLSNMVTLLRPSKSLLVDSLKLELLLGSIFLMEASLPPTGTLLPSLTLLGRVVSLVLFLLPLALVPLSTTELPSLLPPSTV